MRGHGDRATFPPHSENEWGEGVILATDGIHYSSFLSTGRTLQAKMLETRKVWGNKMLFQMPDIKVDKGTASTPYFSGLGIRSFAHRSNQMSDCERFAQIAQDK